MWQKIVVVSRAGIRMALVSCWVLAGLGAAAVTAAPGLSRHRQALAVIWFRGMLRAMNVHVELEGEQAIPGCLQVANHISWLDILVLGSTGSTRFVAKSEIANWPIVGRLAAVMDTVFLPRGANQSSQAAELVGGCLAKGESVLVFPEAKTTDGRSIRRFYARFFAASIDSGKPVQPIGLAYHVPGGNYMAVPYIGELSLGQSLYALLQQPRIHVRVVRQPLIGADNQDRKTLARLARDSIMLGLAHAAVTQSNEQVQRTIPELM